MSTGIVIVFGLIGVTLVLFVTEWIPVDVTAIALMVSLILLEPWTGVGPAQGVVGFSNPATLTVLAMFMLSEGIRRTGAVQKITSWIESITGASEGKSLLSIFAIAGPPSGFINNTPVVAILIPVVRKLARNARVSPSRFLIPLSYISMLGGTLTLIGTSSTIIASDLSDRLIGRSIGMFEFTHLGVLLLVIGALYMYTIGWYTIPDRVKGEENLVEEFEMEEYLTDVRVLNGSELVGQTVREMTHDRELDLDLDVSQIIRDKSSIRGNLNQQTIQAGDILVVRASGDTLKRLMEATHLELHGTETMDQVPDHVEEEAMPTNAETATSLEGGMTLTEVILLPTCPIVGQSIRQSTFRDRFHGTVLAIKRGGSVIREQMKDIELKVGDTLLLQAGPNSVHRISNTQGFVVTGGDLFDDIRTDRIPVAILIMAAVIALPAFNLLPIMVSAFAGVVTMILTGCLRMKEAYDAVSWDVIFLLAGVIPLGLAMENTGADRVLADLILESASFLPIWCLLFLVYLLTIILTNLISNVASVILLLPVAVSVAGTIAVDPFAVVMLVTLGSATAFMTPIGYQTNLMVYGPGGYRFHDFIVAGAGLQLLTGIVLTASALVFW